MTDSEINNPPSRQRVKTPTMLQFEAVECGAVALGIVLRYYGCYIPLEELRVSCGVSRDGSNALNIVKAARRYNLEASGVRRSNLEGLKHLPLPLILYWNFNHFVVFEGYDEVRIYINDPETGPRAITLQEFDGAFTGVVVVCKPGAAFQKTGKPFSLSRTLRQRLVGSEKALSYVLLVSLLLVVPGFIVPAFFRVFVDDIFINRQNWLIPLLVSMGLTFVVRALLTWLQQSYLLRLELKLALSGSSRFFWHVLHLPMTFFAQRFTGDIAYRVQLNSRIAQLLSGELATAAVDLVLMVFYGLLMLQYDLLLALISILFAGLNVALLRYVTRRRADANRVLLQEQGKFMGTTTNGLQLIETLKATGSESDFFARWAGIQVKVVNAEQQLGSITYLVAAMPFLLMLLNTAAVLIIGGEQVIEQRMTIGTLVAFQSLMLSFSQPVSQLINLDNRLQEAESSLNRLADVLQYPLDSSTLPNDEATVKSEDGTSPKLGGLLELRGVSFGYSPLAAPLIDNLNLTVKPGQHIGLMGHSGSGKSTVARLVAGLYTTWDGEIFFDGQPRSNIPRQVLSRSLALVDQSIALFGATIEENLTLWDKTIPRSTIIEAAKDACIHETIIERPGGYESLIQEGGANFSGGERQRLEIARALISDPALLILDEATSALDPVLEQEIISNIRRRGCACLIIAHRQAAVRDCEEIIVLDHGKIVQQGTYQQLIGLGILDHASSGARG